MKKFTQLFDEFHEIVGWFGVSFILIGYALVSLEYIAPDSLLYQGLNAVGAVGIIYTSLKTKSYPVAALNVVWLLIAVFALLSVV